jgi:hypothetical protein
LAAVRSPGEISSEAVRRVRFSKNLWGGMDFAGATKYGKGLGGDYLVFSDIKVIKTNDRFEFE